MWSFSAFSAPASSRASIARDDPVMLGLGDLAAPLCRQRRRRHQRHGPMHEIELLHQVAVVRGQVDLLVKPPVGPRQRRRIAHQRVIAR